MSRLFFADMNAFFASCEQQVRPELRGKPVAVVPYANLDTTCVIAASYEAKALGIKTGTGVKTARRVCPQIELVEARPQVYLDYHAKLLEVLNQYFVTVKVLSVDEMACKIGRLDATREREERLAQRVKGKIEEELGPFLRASIGIGPNVFLAKVASDRQKPNGLTIWDNSNLPEALFGLELLDLPGIANRMLSRLETHNIRTVRQLFEADPITLRRAWGSVVGARWYWMLRGSQEADYGMELGQEHRKSVGHSHVLPSEFRTREGAQQILLRLFSRALKRLRAYQQGASVVEIRMDYRHKYDYTEYSWRRRSSKHLHANTEAKWMKTLRLMLDAIPPTRFNYYPLRASITFTGLLLEKDQNLSLFEDTEAQGELSRTVDRINAKGSAAVDIASVFWLRNQAPHRIAFGPTDASAKS